MRYKDIEIPQQLTIEILDNILEQVEEQTQFDNMCFTKGLPNYNITMCTAILRNQFKNSRPWSCPYIECTKCICHRSNVTVMQELQQDPSLLIANEL